MLHRETQVHAVCHSVGMLFQRSAERDASIMFFAYTMPHPLEHCITIRVATLDNISIGNAMERIGNNVLDEIAQARHRLLPSGESASATPLP